jgi:hypothetical protein
MKKLFLLFLGFSSYSFASDKDSLISKLDSVKTTIGFNAAQNSGVFTSYVLGTNFDSKYKFNKDVLEVYGMARVNNSFSSGSFQTKENEGYISISYSYRYNDLKYILFSENEYSFLRQIKSRNNIGIGFGYKFNINGSGYIEISEAIMPEKIIYYQTQISIIRYSTRFKLHIDLWKGASISNIAYIQPPIWSSDGVMWSENMIMRNNLTFNFMSIKNIEIGLMDAFIYETYPIFLNRQNTNNNLLTISIKTKF